MANTTSPPINSATSNANPVPQTQPSTLQQVAASPGRPALRVKINDTFTRLSKNRWLHDRPELDVYTLLIDTYRLRIHDDLLNKLEINVDSLYCQEGDGGAGGFRRFLQRVESHPARLFPRWWTPTKTEECVQLGLSDEWSSLDRHITKSDVVNHYKDWMMPMQLRAFAESIYTRANGMKGNNLKAQLELENKEASR
ncbi:hypothetical protein PoHVEF18_007059 [Penicillium ochrochloron]